jgi:hypothetical protein
MTAAAGLRSQAEIAMAGQWLRGPSLLGKRGLFKVDWPHRIEVSVAPNVHATASMVAGSIAPVGTSGLYCRAEVNGRVCVAASMYAVALGAADYQAHIWVIDDFVAEHNTRGATRPSPRTSPSR